MHPILFSHCHPKRSEGKAILGINQLRLFSALFISFLALLTESYGKMITLNSPLNSSPAQTIYIYNGPGTSPVAIRHTEYTLKKMVHPRYTLQTIGPEDVFKGAWVNNAALFVMPGGADIPYGASLNSKGNENIQAYVQKGGAYLGFCAGAYYGSKHVAFSIGTPLEVVGDRELGFFPGVAEGPTLLPWDFQSNAGAEAALLQWKTAHHPFPTDHLVTTYFNGGCHFVKADSYPNVTILATYAALPPKAAIVEISIGNGRVILSGVHCEFAPELFDRSDPFLVPVQKKLIPNDHDRQALMAHLLDRLGVETILQ